MSGQRSVFAMDWRSPVAVFSAGFVLRLFRFWLGRPWIDDASLNVPAAGFYTRHGIIAPDNWWTPPLKHLLLEPFLRVFGYDPVGWRMRGILFGSLVVLMVFLVAREAFRKPFVAYAAAALVALDPLSIALSRSTSEDTLAAFVLLVAVYAALRSVRGEAAGWLAVLGATFGVGVALRWYLVIPMAFIALVVLWRYREDRETLVAAPSLILALPIAVYVACYLPWFGRGYGLAEWWALQLDGVRVQGSGFAMGQIEEFRGAWRWLFGYVRGGYVISRSGSLVTAHLTQSNPAVWWAFTPGVLFGAMRGWRMRNRTLVLFAGTFISLYLFCVLSPRPVYLYAALPLVPLGSILLAYGLSALPHTVGRALLVVLLASAVYLYPLTAPLPVPSQAYGWIAGSVRE